MNGTGTGIDYAIGFAPLTYVSVPPLAQRMDSIVMVVYRDVIRFQIKSHSHMHYLLKQRKALGAQYSPERTQP